MHDYNTSRKPLTLKAYGRNVHKLVDTMRVLKDRTERTQHAQGILKLMATLDTSNRHSLENLRKRWDDLFILADYMLEVDSPYPIPTKTALKCAARPQYPQQSIKLKSYGRNIELLVQKAAALKDQEMQEKMIVEILKLMKNLGSVWHHDNVSCGTLLAYIKHIAKEPLIVDFEKLKGYDIGTSMQLGKNRGGKVSRNTGRGKRLHRTTEET